MCRGNVAITFSAEVVMTRDRHKMLGRLTRGAVASCVVIAVFGCASDRVAGLTENGIAPLRQFTFGGQQMAPRGAVVSSGLGGSARTLVLRPSVHPLFYVAPDSVSASALLYPCTSSSAACANDLAFVYGDNNLTSGFFARSATWSPIGANGWLTVFGGGITYGPGRLPTGFGLTCSHVHDYVCYDEYSASNTCGTDLNRIYSGAEHSAVFWNGAYGPLVLSASDYCLPPEGGGGDAPGQTCETYYDDIYFYYTGSGWEIYTHSEYACY